MKTVAITTREILVHSSNSRQLTEMLALYTVHRVQGPTTGFSPKQSTVYSNVHEQRGILQKNSPRRDTLRCFTTPKNKKSPGCKTSRSTSQFLLQHIFSALTFPFGGIQFLYQFAYLPKSFFSTTRRQLTDPSPSQHSTTRRTSVTRKL